MNLTNVYLDAVFLPKVLKDRKRFCQEGWHIGFDEEGNPEYRGVVFNEMKGAMSETETMIEREVCGMLFRDNYNGFNSGAIKKIFLRIVICRSCDNNIICVRVRFFTIYGGF